MATATGTTYPSPGRGAWTLTGGLLPAKPSGTGRTGYYRQAALGEKMIGAAFSFGADTSHEARVVSRGVAAIQTMIGLSGNDVDGWFGPQTGARTVVMQKKWGVEADGIIGRTTMRAGLTEMITDIASANQVPVALLGGLVVNESALDPAAVGVNGVDHGIAQINLSAHPDVSVDQALDPQYALMFAAEDLSMVHRTWVGRTKADPWDVAIANHNSPALARQWARNGSAPFVPGRVFQIEDYVIRVKESW